MHGNCAPPAMTACVQGIYDFTPSRAGEGYRTFLNNRRA